MTKEELLQEINRFAKQVVLHILRDYQDTLGFKNDMRLRELLKKDFVVLDAQELPHEDDGLVHIYLDKEDVKGLSFAEMANVIKKDILVREIFRYIIHPSLNEDKSEYGEVFSNKITEGLVLKYAEDFSVRHGLGTPNVHDEEAKRMATVLLNGIPKEVKKDALFFQYQYPFMLNYYKVGTGKDFFSQIENGELKEKVTINEVPEIIYNEAEVYRKGYGRGFLKASLVIVACLFLGVFLAVLLLR